MPKKRLAVQRVPDAAAAAAQRAGSEKRMAGRCAVASVGGGTQAAAGGAPLLVGGAKRSGKGARSARAARANAKRLWGVADESRGRAHYECAREGEQTRWP